MVSADSLKLYLAVKKREERSQMEDSLVLDGLNIRTFASASRGREVRKEQPERSSAELPETPAAAGGRPSELPRSLRPSRLCPGASFAARRAPAS